MTLADNKVTDNLSYDKEIKNMTATLLRTVVVYILVIVGIRIMGKRQIGELQPGELVITIMISECAAFPIQDLSRPVANGIISVFTLIILEII